MNHIHNLMNSPLLHCHLVTKDNLKITLLSNLPFYKIYTFDKTQPNIGFEAVAFSLNLSLDEGMKKYNL